MSTRVSRIPTGSRFATWLALIGLCAGIFAASAQPHLNSGLGSWDVILRKSAHLTVFGLLALAAARVARVERVAVRGSVAGAWCFTAAYAASDEWHQSFVTGRSATIHDVAIDAAGATVALVWLRRRWDGVQ